MPYRTYLAAPLTRVQHWSASRGFKQDHGRPRAVVGFQERHPRAIHQEGGVEGHGSGHDGAKGKQQMVGVECDVCRTGQGARGGQKEERAC